MKIKYACGLLVVLLLSATLVPFPAQAGPTSLKWAKVHKPGQDGNTVVSPSEVSDIAVGRSGVLYAIDSENSQVYRSLDAGVTWEEDITSRLVRAGAELPASKIVVAPDKPGTVAVVTDNGTKVYLSTDGGSRFTQLAGNPGGAGSNNIEITAIDVTSLDGSNIIAAATRDKDGSQFGGVYVLDEGKTLPTWDDTIVGSYDVYAIAFSPNFATDQQLVAVVTDETDTLVTTKIGGDWGQTVGDAKLDNSGASVAVDTSAAIVFPSDYDSDVTTGSYIQFVAIDAGDENGDVYMVDGVEAPVPSVATDLNIGAEYGLSNVDVTGLASRGDAATANLLAGAAGSAEVYLSTDGGTSWTRSTVPPTGPGNVKVGWSPDGKIAYCGTGQSPGAPLDESAFSASLDGDKWRQLGLIDTVINLADIVPAPDSESLFVTTYSPLGPEGIWRSAGDPIGSRWERLLTIDTSDTSAGAVILRLSPNYSDDYTMYAAEVGGNQIAVSHNRGNSWEWSRGDPGPVIDMVIGDEETIYVALPEGYVRKSVNGAFTWQGTVETRLPKINMLVLVDEETILVGGKNGAVAYSTDGGASFSRIREIFGSGDVQVVADANFQKNGTIYAATNRSDEGIWRWVIGVSTQWEQIDESITELAGGQRIGGLAASPEGTLYALRLEPATSTSGGITRSLNPLAPDPEDVEFDLVNDTLPVSIKFDPTLVFPNTLPYLNLSGDSEQNEFWTIDSANQIIYRFRDTLSKLGPIPEMPEAGGTVPIDSSGYVSSLILSWEELVGATRYEAAIYLDSDATEKVWSETTTGNGVRATRGESSAQLISDTTYYWRVRSIAPIKSPWSRFRSFTPALGGAQWSPLAAPAGISPLPGANNVPIRPVFAWQPADWATGYEFMLAKDSQFTNMVVAMTGADALQTTVWGYDRDLDYSTTYFWKVRAASANSYSEWGTGVFTTEAPPSTPLPPQSSLPPSPPPAPTPSIPSYLLGLVIGIGVTLVVALLVLTVRTGR